MITTEHIPQLDKITMNFEQKEYPQCRHEYTPRCYGVIILAGSRGSGKTYSCVKLLKIYERFGMWKENERVDQRIFLISPTFQSNEVWNCLKHLDRNDVYENYDPSVLQGIIDEIKREKNETERYQKQRDVWRKFVSNKRLSQEELFELNIMNYEPPLPCNHPTGLCCHLIIDDMVGSKLFSNGRSPFTKATIGNRHIGFNLYILSQALKCIPKTIRSNCSCFILFKFCSTKIIVDDLYEEISGLISLDDFSQIFDFATSNGPFNFLKIDFSMPEGQRFSRNFDTILRIK